jgi:glycosyltransferase involved in cell wall biosynthesis
MKVGIDCRLINKIQNTGISRYTEFLIEYYVNRFESENISLITNDKKFEYKDCKIIYTKLKPYNILHFIVFSKFLDNIGLDLFHVPFYSGFFKKSSVTKVIITVHDLMYHFVEGFFGKIKILNYLKIKYFDFIVKKSLVNANKIVSVSQTTKKDVFETFGFYSIHIPEDSEITGAIDFSILYKYNLSNKGFFFYCGNNRSHKNIDFIIDIFSSNPNLPLLVLAGKGHQNFENVLAIGIVSEEELKVLYKSTIAFVFPSKYEGFGLPVLEALRSETFVIASKIPAFLEFKTENIFFFELENKKEFIEAIEKTLSNDFITDELFLDCYDKKNIYELNDIMINNLLKIDN